MRSRPPTTRPGVTEEQLGTQSFEGLTLTGVRKSRTVNAERSGTGQPVVITDEYWYSPELSIYLIIKHNDPRTGEQIVAVSKVQRAEPDASGLPFRRTTRWWMRRRRSRSCQYRSSCTFVRPCCRGHRARSTSFPFSLLLFPASYSVLPTSVLPTSYFLAFNHRRNPFRD